MIQYSVVWHFIEFNKAVIIDYIDYLRKFTNYKQCLSVHL